MFVNVPKKLERYLLETKIGAPATLALCAVAGGHVVLQHITKHCRRWPNTGFRTCRVAGINERHPSSGRLGRWAFPLAAPPTAKILAAFPLVLIGMVMNAYAPSHCLAWDPYRCHGAVLNHRDWRTRQRSPPGSMKLVFRLLLIEAGAM